MQISQIKYFILYDVLYFVVMCCDHCPLIIYLYKTGVIERQKKEKRKEGRKGGREGDFNHDALPM